MKINQLAAKPQLIKITLDEANIVAQYGEPVEFWTYDRQPLETFMKLANANNQDMGAMIGIIRTLILDENGKEVINNENMLPSNVLILAISKIVEALGK